MMLDRLLHHFLPPALSAPSLWGKLPCFGDYVHQNAQAQDMDAWQTWFMHHPIQELVNHDSALQLQKPHTQQAQGWLHLNIERRASNAHPQPWCFVIPAGVLQTSAHIPAEQAIVGVFANSCDQVGRLHPVVIWQSVQTDLSDALQGTKNWLFWLSQLLQSHTPPFSTPNSPNKTSTLSTQLTQMWACAQSSMVRAPFGLFHKDLSEAALNQIVEQGLPAGTSLVGPHSESLCGVAQLPWPTWSEPNTHGYFWQQAANGEYINAVKFPLNHAP
jgi:type VI secretion system protein ImpM